MKIYVDPPPTMSNAMFRVARALKETAPAGVRIVNDVSQADLLIMHVIGLDAIDYERNKMCAVVQYCLCPASGVMHWWHPLWERAKAVWSYYDLTPYLPAGARFYHAPMGVNGAFTKPIPFGPRDLAVLTSGYVNGPGAEAIEEVTVACQELGLKSIHLGPRPTNMSPDVQMQTVYNISDVTLASLYRRCQYVSGLRFVEGFELPALEGLVCGARPIMFRRPDARWFNNHACFVTEQHGRPLIDELKEVLSRSPYPVEN